MNDKQDKARDSNDILREKGVDGLREAFDKAHESGSKAKGKPDDKPKKPRAASGNRRANHLGIVKCLRSDPELQGIVSYDEFSQQIILERPLPRPGHPKPAIFERRAWQDNDDTILAVYLNSVGFLKVAKLTIRDAIEHEARDKSFHPLRDRLNALVWDGEPRLSNWLIDYCGAYIGDPTAEGEAALKEIEDRRAYIHAVSRATLIGGVARIIEPGCKMDTMLVLEGPQGSLKSQLLRSLALEDRWFSDTLPHNLASKDAKEHLPGLWLIEMSELSQIRASEVEALKTFLSTNIDKFRPPYGRGDVKNPRQCIFIGTTNEDAYLHDATGNRRFWSVKIERIDLAAVRANREQLWAEAVAAYRAGEKWWLKDSVEAIAAREQADRMETDPWHALIARHVGASLGPFTTATILTSEEFLGIPKGNQTKVHEMRIGKIFRLLGLVRKTLRQGPKSTPTKVYVKANQEGEE